ncbi:MAG: ABC transporter permease subunit [Saprospiraceae bacterium]
MDLFKLRGKLSKSQTLILGIAGIFLFIAIWWILAELLSVNRPLVELNAHLPSSIDQSPEAQALRDSILLADSIALANATEFEKVYPLLPRPDQTIAAFKPLYQEDHLFYNTFRSIWLNIQGYFWAVLLAIPLGFLIGLIPAFRGLFSRQVDTLRYLPLTAVTVVFITWFGLEDEMKIAFLAFGIMVYLLPVVVQRIDEVNDVFLQTTFTLGATDWQTIKTVYWPAVMSKLMDDIRVLTAISWTYIIIAELLNRQGGGIGALIYLKQRQGQLDRVFALLIVIVFVGFLQDRFFDYMDRRFFPHKYYSTNPGGIKEVEYGLGVLILAVAIAIIIPIIIPGLSGVIGNFAGLAAVAAVILTLFGEYRIQKSVLD